MVSSKNHNYALLRDMFFYPQRFVHPQRIYQVLPEEVFHVLMKSERVIGALADFLNHAFRLEFSSVDLSFLNWPFFLRPWSEFRHFLLYVGAFHHYQDLMKEVSKVRLEKICSALSLDLYLTVRSYGLGSSLTHLHSSLPEDYEIENLQDLLVTKGWEIVCLALQDCPPSFIQRFLLKQPLEEMLVFKKEEKVYSENMSSVFNFLSFVCEKGFPQWRA